MSTITAGRRKLLAQLRTIAHARPLVSIETLAVAASVYFGVASNQTFFRAVAATGALHGAKGALTFASLFVAIVPTR